MTKTPPAPATSAVADPEKLRAALREVIDPEAGMNIVDLGLIYRIEAFADRVEVDMTMTSAACPLGEMLVEEVDAALRRVLPAATRTVVALVWSPAWEPSRMSEKARRHFA